MAAIAVAFTLIQTTTLDPYFERLASRAATLAGLEDRLRSLEGLEDSVALELAERRARERYESAAARLNELEGIDLSMSPFRVFRRLLAERALSKVTSVEELTVENSESDRATRLKLTVEDYDSACALMGAITDYRFDAREVTITRLGAGRRARSGFSVALVFGR